jgi:hypothetical protein
MARPRLKTCPFLGPIGPKETWSVRVLPADHATRPLAYLPPPIMLSEAELDLASRYEKGDFSGGYVASQVAYFRRGPTPERHRERHERFRRLKEEVDRCGLVLPAAYIELVERDDFVSRLRHNTIWLRLPSRLVPLSSRPDHRLFLIFAEGQGCGFWHLLLALDGGHVVTFSKLSFDPNSYPGGRAPEPSPSNLYQCAENFSQWIVNYFAECVEGDRHYDRLLEEFG